jgi:RNA polymerase sigma-70 factor (ECF subfamily)
MTDSEFPRPLQDELQPAWNRYVDFLAPYRADLHRYCVRLAGSLWDGEDLVQDTVVRVFAMLGKRWASIDNPRAYLARIATNLWIDRVRRRELERSALAREMEETAVLDRDPGAASPAEVRDAARTLLERLTARERVAVLMKDVLDLSLHETASILRTTTAAVKAALHRGRERLTGDAPPAGGIVPPRDLVDRFVAAFNARDLAALEAIVSADVRVELVGGNEMHGSADSEDFFAHALARFPGEDRDPRFSTMDYRGEPIVLGFRSRNGVEMLNDASRLEASDDGRVAAIRCYCWCPDTLRVLADELRVPVSPRPYRSPTLEEIQRMLSGA